MKNCIILQKLRKQGKIKIVEKSGKNVHNCRKENEIWQDFKKSLKIHHFRKDTKLSQDLQKVEKSVDEIG